jgi:hypothetical protein
LNDAAFELNSDEALEFIAGELLQAEEDILFFAENVRTHDSHAKGERILPFPTHKNYIRKLFTLAVTHPRFAIYKSRQMLVTWVMCIVCLWEVLFHPGSVVALISLSQEDSGVLLERIKLIYENLPAHWLVALPQPRFYRGKKGIVLRMVVEHLNGPASTIDAYAQNGNPGRGRTVTLAYWDEVGECGDLECRAMYSSLRPTLENGGRLVMSSTPPRSPVHFWEQFCTGQYFGDGQQAG